MLVLPINRNIHNLVKDLLAKESTEAFPWEWKSEEEITHRHLRKPETCLSEARVRFSLMLQYAQNAILRGDSVCDFGAYPGTFVRIARTIGGVKCPLSVAGLGFSNDFLQGMERLQVRVMNLEFDVRQPRFSEGNHILSFPLQQTTAPFDLAICTEVIEHQMYPLSLLIGINRFLRRQGHLLLTTNSASFIGDILKLSVGRHNVEALERSHVLTDSQWRPHIRLYTLRELTKLLHLAGFEVQEGFYFDYGSVYRGPKGWGIAAIRSTASIIPHLRSHIFIRAIKTGEPSETSMTYITETIKNYNLQESILSH